MTYDFILSSDQLCHTVVLWCSRLVYAFIVFSNSHYETVTFSSGIIYVLLL
jgi:hypothetical protein